MPITANSYGPYDSGAGANITENFWRLMTRWFGPAAVAAGYLNELNPFGDSTGLQAKVDTGGALVRGAYGEWTSVSILGLAAVGGIPGGQSRIDRLIVRNDFVNNLMQLDVLTGTAAVSPTPPALTQTTSMYEMALADIPNIVNTTTTITAAMVQDRRWKITESGILFAERTPSGVATTTFDLSTLPATARHLRFSGSVRSDVNAASADLYAQFASGNPPVIDTAASYVFQQFYGNNNVMTDSQGVAATAQPGIARVTALTASANQAGNFDADCFNFSGTTWVKEMIARSQDWEGTLATQEFLVARGFRWNSTAALTAILLGLTAGNFVSGSRITCEVRP